MNELEQRLRDALRGTAATVDEHVERPFPERASRRARSRLPVVPLAAAVAVLVVLAAIVGIVSLRDGGKPEPQQRPNVPRFVLLSVPAKAGRPSRLEVRETLGGRLTASRDITDPGWEFDRVVGTGGGREFVVRTVPREDEGCAARLLRVSVGAAGELAEPRAMELRAPSGQRIEDVALAPSGRVAYWTQSCGAAEADGGTGAPVEGTLTVTDPSTAASRSWKVQDPLASLPALTWLPDGRHLLFSGEGMLDGGTLHLLDTATTRSGDVVKAGRVLFTSTEGSVVAVTPVNGGRSLLLAVREGGRPKGRVADGGDLEPMEPLSTGVKLVRISLSGTVERAVVPVPVRRPSDVLTVEADSSGRHVLVRSGFADVDSGRFTPLPWLGGVTDVAW
ncbi:hypothetical protein [Actinomadura kijaniata]|uniref:hypothetical protein n=1 Tax=Actinomadura kijaniata TaxID=46161 RepID=UPI0008369C56|nr:hypothetical protein [Actinomadura kijaniata]